MDYTSKIKLWKDMAVGNYETISKTLTESDMILWGGVSGDMNLLHFDLEYSKSKRFGDIVVPGLCVAGLISAAVTKLTFGNIYVTQNLQFVKPIYVGDTITATATITGIIPEKHMVKIETTCQNQNGELVITGEAMQYIIE